MNPNLEGCSVWFGGGEVGIGVGGNKLPENPGQGDESPPASPPGGSSDPGDSTPQPWSQFVPGPDCTRPFQSCIPLPQGVCDVQIADYQARLATDPTIPAEDWTAGHVIHYNADGTVALVEAASCADLADPATPPVVLPQVTDAVVAAAFTTFPLPVPAAHMNPPFPACAAVNLPNYFYVDPVDTSAVTVTLLGTPVTVFPHILDYTWDFGDGQHLTTQDPGAPYPQGKNIHVYRSQGRFPVTVTVRWGADWQSPAHARAAVPGQTTTVSPPGIVWAHAYHVVLVNDPNAPLPTKPHDPADVCYQR